MAAIREREAEKRRAATRDRQEQIERFKQSLVGLTQAERSVMLSRFKAGLREEQEAIKIEREAARAAVRMSKQQERHEKAMEAERRRAERLVELGLISEMRGSARREWFARCEVENPLLFAALIELGVNDGR
jgi:hypothetical protein